MLMPYLLVSQHLVCTMGCGVQVFSGSARDAGGKGTGKGMLETEKRDGKRPAKHPVDMDSGERHKY